MHCRDLEIFIVFHKWALCLLSGIFQGHGGHSHLPKAPLAWAWRSWRSFHGAAREIISTGGQEWDKGQGNPQHWGPGMGRGRSGKSSALGARNGERGQGNPQH